MPSVAGFGAVIARCVPSEYAHDLGGGVAEAWLIRHPISTALNDCFAERPRRMAFDPLTHATASDLVPFHVKQPASVFP